VKHSLAKIALFEIALNAFVVFLVIYLISFIFNIPLKYGIFLTLVYVIFFTFRRMTRDNIRIVETQFDNLDEKFRTAVDNQYVDNPVVNELQAEVLRDLKRVDEASFFNSTETYAKIGVIVILCFLIFFFSPVSLAAMFNIDVSKLMPGDQTPTTAGTSDDDAVASGGGTEEGGTLFGDEDIYGTPFLATLGEEEVFVTLNPGGYEMNVREIHDVQPVEFDEAYPDEVFATSGEVFEEQIPVEQQELVKNYFKQLAEGG
jgi:hypothetical protein